MLFSRTLHNLQQAPHHLPSPVIRMQQALQAQNPTHTHKTLLSLPLISLSCSSLISLDFRVLSNRRSRTRDLFFKGLVRCMLLSDWETKRKLKKMEWREVEGSRTDQRWSSMLSSCQFWISQTVGRGSPQLRRAPSQRHSQRRPPAPRRRSPVCYRSRRDCNCSCRLSQEVADRKTTTTTKTSSSCPVRHHMLLLLLRKLHHADHLHPCMPPAPTARWKAPPHHCQKHCSS